MQMNTFNARLVHVRLHMFNILEKEFTREKTYYPIGISNTI